MHIDINSCFATVMQQAYVHLRGKPIAAVAYETDKGCILSPSIEAKRYGIKTGMRVFEARRLYPALVLRQPEVGLIRDVHLKFLAICQSYSPVVSPKSIDETVIDFAPVTHLLHQDLIGIAQEIKKRIRVEIGEWISCSIGIATNRFLAKVGARLHKPDGLDMISHYNLESVYKSLLLIDLPGINIRYQIRLNRYGILTPLQFFGAPLVLLKKQVFQSIVGYYWYQRLRGWEVDSVEYERKSFGQDYALEKKTDERKELLRLLLKLTEKMGRRLRKAGFAAQGVHLALWYADGSFWHHGKKTGTFLSTTYELYEAEKALFDQQPKRNVVTKIAVRCYDIIAQGFMQQSLFAFTNKRRLLADALDRINDRYGEYTATPARMMDMDKTILDRIAFGKGGIPV
ncbi:hypothetical protein HY468_05370 [Candidatus Roizmanbacteria bacterium]|nr:hypothetical protein [Candidatus Roizmanbacteria bacterium]